jgi:glycosyltransferase involved in cell wall biosynthesis
MEKLRIVQLITELGPAGAERCVFELARRLNKERFDTQVVALRGGEVAQWLADEGIPVTVLGVRGKWDIMKLARLTELLRAERPDILHTHLFHADLAGRPAARLAGVPHVITTVHVAEARFRPWQFAYARLLGGACERIICVSASVRDYHAQRSGLPHSLYTVIPNGIDASAYAHDEAARIRLREQWGVEPDQVLVAFVGRLDHQKGIDTLLGAMSHLGARGTPMHLVIAGDGPKRSLVENFISHGEGGGFCRWLGFYGDVRSLLSAADIFVLPSRWEGFGLAAAEAMAAGLPVIGTPVPGLRELLLHAKTGIVVERNDTKALADSIHRLAEDAELRARLGEAGRARVIEKHDIARNILAHERLYLEIAGPARARPEGGNAGGRPGAAWGRPA